MDHENSVVVTGMGIVSSIGKDIKSFEDSLKKGRSGISYLDREPDSPNSIKIGAQIKDFAQDSSWVSQSEGMRKIRDSAIKCTRRSSKALKYAVSASMQAWEMSGFHRFLMDPYRVGLIVAGNNINQNLQYHLHDKFMENPEYLSPTYALQFMDTDHIGTISEIFQMRGEGFTVGGASSSGNVGIIKGSQLIQLGNVDACVVIGAMADISPMEFQAFYNIGAMGGRKYIDSPEKASRPFDADSEGFLYGQASGCILLESKKSARERNAHVIAEIMGSGMVLDGNKMSNPNVKGEAKAMACALERANMGIDEIDYINAHGSSSPLGDATELTAIDAVFGEKKKQIWLNSTKSLTGHCLWSAGVVEAIATILQLNGNIVHPNLNLEHPISNDFKFCKKKYERTRIETAMSNSFGFGGINTSIIIKKGDRK